MAPHGVSINRSDLILFRDVSDVVAPTVPIAASVLLKAKEAMAAHESNTEQKAPVTELDYHGPEPPIWGLQSEDPWQPQPEDNRDATMPKVTSRVNKSQQRRNVVKAKVRKSVNKVHPQSMTLDLPLSMYDI